ncbi:MAG TPA: hypothetical protein DIU39_02775 [Flavobacteriales bacterium]|nr:hypothetical protein [Flavobacteriales bacterium]|tara:strand:- start:63230 stop:64417 length:1188 start_codon:yes stop_codon:yes gene_type:complete
MSFRKYFIKKLYQPLFFALKIKKSNTNFLTMKKFSITLCSLLMISSIANAQLSNIKNKVKSNISGSNKQKSVKKQKTYTLEEINANPYVDYDRVVVTENGPVIFKGVYKNGFTDDIGFSGVYYLNSYAIVQPANHFSHDTTKLYIGFSINYNQEKHNMQVYWEKNDSNYAMVPERYHSSADKGNVMFQMGMSGGPESYYNAECLVLEPGTFLVGAYVYHKNDKEGHAWMNNVTPESFVIASKDTSKFKDYQKNPEYTSKVVFEKYDALRAAWKNQEIKDAKPLPAEGMKNAQLKNEATNLITQHAKGYKWKETVEYAYITSGEWEIKRHPLTGIPIKRIAKAIVVMKTPQGNYKREGFYIAQDHTGNNQYGKTYMLYNDQRIYYVNPKDAFQYKN